MPKPRSNARHPVEALLRQSVSCGQAPHPDDVAALDLPAPLRKRFDNAVAEALGLWGGGDRAQANETALHASRDVLADLPDDLHHPGYNHRDPLADTDDPAALAAAVSASRGY